MVSSLVRGLGEWLRGSCWSKNSPSDTSASSRNSRPCSSSIAINRRATAKYQRSLERLSEESLVVPSLPRSPSPSPLIADESGLKEPPPYKHMHATTCSMETAVPLVFNISSQQPLTIAFTNTHKTSRVFPSTCKSDSAHSSYTPQLQSEAGDDEFNDFELECLMIHNEYREKHGVPPLRLNKEMCVLARGMATGLCGNTQLPVLTLRDIANIKKMCKFAEGMATALCGTTQLPPMPDRKYGEIVLVSRLTEPISAYEACHKWYGQSHNFEFGVEPKASKSRKSKCNFTQMIWKGTRDLGIGVAHVDGTSAVVGLYYPPGNVSGQYIQNCPRPQELCPF